MEIVHRWSTLFYLVCLIHLATTVATAYGKHCENSVGGESSVPQNSSCDVTEGGHGLLQMASDDQLHPALAAGEEAVSIFMLEQMAASKTKEDRDGVPTRTHISMVRSATGLLSFGKGIKSAADHNTVQLPSRDSEELADSHLAASVDEQDAGYSKVASVGDVSSLVTLPDLSNGSKNPHQQLLMLADLKGKAQSVAFFAVAIVIMIVFISLLLMIMFSDSPRDHDGGELFSSDSEKFGSSPKYRHRLSPKMPARDGRSDEPSYPVQEEPRGCCSPVPPVSPSIQRLPPPSQTQSRLSPVPSSRDMGTGSVPLDQMQPPPSDTQMPPAAMATAPAPGSGLTGRSSTSSQGLSQRYLCPGLVVPQKSECTVAVPTLRALGVPPRNTAGFFVRDISGKPVIQAEILVQPWTSVEGGVVQQPVAVLRTITSSEAAPASIDDLSPLLAYVKASLEAGGRRIAYIYDARDEIFANVAKDRINSCYILTSSRMRMGISFKGNFNEHAVHVTSDAIGTVAEVEPCNVNFDSTGEYYKVRVVSHMDVGLIVCGLFAIQHMEAP